MKRLRNLLTILTVILISFTAVQPAVAQESVQLPNNIADLSELSNDVLDPTSPAFQAELQDLQIANPQLGPDHDLVYPGDIIVFADGTVHIIEPGEYQSMILLEYLQQQQLEAGQVVSVIRSGQPNILISQDSGTDWPWYIWLALWVIALALVWQAFNSGYSGEVLSSIHRVIKDGGVNIHNTHHYLPPNDDKEEVDESDIVELLLPLLVFNSRDFERDTERGHSYQNAAPVVVINGNGDNKISFGNDSSEEEREPKKKNKK